MESKEERYNTYKIKDLVILNKKSLNSSTDWDYIYYLDTGNITENRINELTRYPYPSNDVPSRAKRIVDNGTIIYSTVRPNQLHYGILNNIPDNLVVSTGFVTIDVIKSKADEKYIFYYLTQRDITEKLHVIAEQSVSTYPSIKADDIGEIEIDLPPLETQRKIASILSAIDDKIELNNRINENLEEQAKFLYKSWFIDYEPFGGMKPVNWKNGSIYDIADITYGAPFASKLFNTNMNGKPIIRIRDLKNQEFVTYTTEKHSKGYLLQKGDIVVGMDGEFRPYIWGNDEAWLNQRVCVFNSKRPKGKFYLLFSLKPQLDFIEQTEAATTVIHIGKNDFDKFTALIPDEETLDKFDEVTSPLYESIVNNMLENKRLAELRDTLLPKLMSGEINVDNVEI